MAHEIETKSTHTPTPWKASDDGAVWTKDHPQVTGEYARHITNCVGENRKENAAFIVRAVNNLDDMLNALKQVQIIIDAQGGADRLGIAIAKVIAKAEGK